MAKFSPIFLSFLFAISFAKVAASNGNGGSDVVKVAEQIIQMKGGGGINEFERELAAKQAVMKQGIVVNLTLNEIGEIMKFLEETFDNDYFMVLRMGMWEKFYLLDNLKKLIEEKEKGSQQKHPKGIRSPSVLSDEKIAHAKLVNILMPSLLSSPTINEFCSKNSDFQCAALQTESLYKFGAFLMQNLLAFCRPITNTIKCREWWHLFRGKLHDSVASDYYSNGAEKQTNPLEMQFYMTYIQYIRRWRTKMNKFTIPLPDMLKWSKDSGTKFNGKEELQQQKIQKIEKMPQNGVDELANEFGELSTNENVWEWDEELGQKVEEWNDWVKEKKQAKKEVKMAKKAEKESALNKLVDEAIKEPKFRIVYAKNGTKPSQRTQTKRQESKVGNAKDMAKNGRRPVIARLYYYFFDRQTGEGVNHGGVLLDDTEFHFSNNGGVEIFPKDGYKAEGYSADVMFDYEVGFTSKTQLQIQLIFDKLAEGKFGPGKYTSEKGNQTASNNCVTFLKDFILLILDRPPVKWPYPLSKAFYGTFKQFSDEMAEYLTNTWLKWEKGLVRARTASRAPTIKTWRH